MRARQTPSSAVGVESLAAQGARSARQPKVDRSTEERRTASSRGFTLSGASPSSAELLVQEGARSDARRCPSSSPADLPFAATRSGASDIDTSSGPSRARHAFSVAELLDRRPELRGVGGFAEIVHDAIRWSA